MTLSFPLRDGVDAVSAPPADGSGAETAHRFHEGVVHGYVGGRRQLVESEPSDVVVLLGSDVRRRSPPATHVPSTEERRLLCRSCRQPTQMRRRARRYLDAELLVQFPCERAQF